MISNRSSQIVLFTVSFGLFIKQTNKATKKAIGENKASQHTEKQVYNDLRKTSGVKDSKDIGLPD